MNAFVERYGGIYEHSPWVAESVFTLLADGDDSPQIPGMQRLADLMADCVDNATRDRQLALIRAHPDLAGKAQLRGELTEESTHEQSSAGLDQCSEEELAAFQRLNDEYKQKFGFVFIMAVRDSSRAEILAAFAARLDNDPATEFETALQEIHKIARLRLAALEEEA